MFTPEDNQQITAHGINSAQAEEQIERFKRGFKPANLAASATIGEGILKIDAEEEKQLLALYNNYQQPVSKFVPASGAASRMFKHLFEFSANYKDEDYEAFTREKGKVWEFFKDLSSFAFYQDLKASYESSAGNTLEEGQLRRDYKRILDHLLGEEGLNYGQLPKGLLKFHNYKEGARTASHEQLVEGLAYAEKAGKLDLHFTVSPEHQQLFETHLAKVMANYNLEIDISYSIQKPSTDTIAVDLANEPFRPDGEKLLFRPAGHGALLENLNEQQAHVVFVKNIDNVVPDRLKPETIKFKKLLAGVLLHYQNQAFELLKRSDSGEDITKEATDLLVQLGFKGDLNKEQAIAKLNRPIRVCGMVRNEGEPGGGPFWVKASDGTVSLQIVEAAQIDTENAEQSAIMKASTHFNPVDIVCGLRDYQGNKFDLSKYRDPDTGFVTEKSSGGRTLKAMELPGLWNGSMADWNTIFVEVPLITFNPVKTVNDLLRPQHQN